VNALWKYQQDVPNDDLNVRRTDGDYKRNGNHQYDRLYIGSARSIQLISCAARWMSRRDVHSGQLQSQVMVPKSQKPRSCLVN
jgi:hypothetical protein